LCTAGKTTSGGYDWAAAESLLTARRLAILGGRVLTRQDLMEKPMDKTGSTILGVCIVIASLIFTVAQGSEALPQRDEGPTQVGRFQVAGVPGHAYVLDTATGQVWETFATESQGSSDMDFKERKLK
jgi:hypothetical protein